MSTHARHNKSESTLLEEFLLPETEIRVKFYFAITFYIFYEQDLGYVFLSVMIEEGGFEVSKVSETCPPMTRKQAELYISKQVYFFCKLANVYKVSFEPANSDCRYESNK